MPLWLLLTLTAAAGQNLRSSVQKHLKGRLGTGSVTWVRFGFGWPFALCYLFGIAAASGFALPSPPPVFFAYATVAALAQVGAQALLIALFSLRNFAAGSAYARVEPVFAAMLAPALLGDVIGWGAAFGIGVSVAGVVLVSLSDDLSPRGVLAALRTRAAGMGLASALLFGLSAVLYRGAALSLDVADADGVIGGWSAMLRGAATNSYAIVLQTVLVGAWLTWREPAQWGRIAAAWRPSLLVGFVGATVSLGWFAAFALQQAAIVKAVAQVELILAILTSALVFRERVAGTEIVGACLIGAGVVALLAV